MLQAQFVIVATDTRDGSRFECFTWCRDADSGIARAKREAVRFGMAAHLADYRAEAIN